MATIKDVARLAGVSTATVSHVFNETRFVSEEVKQRVKDAARELGYVSNSIAKSLRSNRSYQIGLLVPDITTYFAVDILRPIQTILEKKGYKLVLGYSYESIVQEREQVTLFNQQQIEGMLLFPALGDHSYLADRPRNYPIVFMDRLPDGDIKGDFVGFDYYNATYDVVSLMLREGHRRIGMVYGSTGLSIVGERLAGYDDAFRAYGLEPDPSLIITGEHSSESGYAIAKQLIQNGTLKTLSALIVYNNLMSIGVLACFADMGVRIPQDLVLVGVGDYSWYDITNPPLSALTPLTADMGRRAAEILLQRIEHGGTDYQDIRLPMNLVRRRSF